MLVSVVICTRNRHETIGQAIESVAQSDFAEKQFNIHIMDQSTNALTRDIVEKLAETYEKKCLIVYHHLQKAGLSAACNAGLRASDGSIIAVTDDDVVVAADWLSQIASVFTNDSEVGLLFGQVLIPKELMDQVSRGEIIVPALPFEKYERMSAKDGFHLFGMGANMAIRRTTLELVGSFDEALGCGGPLRSSGDSDFAYRVYRFGGVIALAPQVKVYHYGTRTQEQWPFTMMTYGIGDGGFYSKHMRCGDPLAYWLFVKHYLRSYARELKRFITTGKWVREEYGRNLLVGRRDSKDFGIDRKYRLYQESDRAKITETESNKVTATKRNAGA